MAPLKKVALQETDVEKLRVVIRTKKEEILSASYSYYAMRPRHLLFPPMDNSPGQSLLPHCQNFNQHRSTTDLLPKSRAEARKARQQAARSKLNLIARQLYELKYDHQWQEQQLRTLLHHADQIQLKTQENMDMVRQVEQAVAKIVTTEMALGLSFQEKENGLGSERSTQPQRQQCDGSLWRERRWSCQAGIHSNAEQTSSQTIITSVKNEKQAYSPTKMRRSSSLKPSSAKKAPAKQKIASLPIANIIIFVALLVIVLALL